MSDYKNDPMKRLVYKHDVIVALAEKTDEPIDFVEALKDLPAVDAVEVRHAEWQLIHKDKNFIKDIYQCSGCRFLVTGTQEIAYDYCPYCGARMDGGVDG